MMSDRSLCPPVSPQELMRHIELSIWGSGNITAALEWGTPPSAAQMQGEGGGRGAAEGASPTPALLCPGSHPAAAPTMQLLAFQDFELGRMPARFISEGAENGKRRRSRGFPSALPRLGWMVSSRSKPSCWHPGLQGVPPPWCSRGGMDMQNRGGGAGFGGGLPCSP